MRTVVTMLALALGSCLHAQLYNVPKGSVPGQARVAMSAAGREVRVDQRLKEFVPLDTMFKDESGRAVKLGDYFYTKPVLVLPVFYRCPGICAMEFNSLAASLGGFKKHFVGKDFEVVVIGIDPKELPAVARRKKDDVIAMYLGGTSTTERRIAAENGFHFLTGNVPNIRRATDALGFRFTYDEKNSNIVHPPGLMVLTPAGQISRYFLGEQLPQQVLLDSIKEAGKNRIGVKDDRPFFLACVQIDPMTGQRTLNVLNTVKTMGLVTLAALAVSIVRMNKKYRRRGRAE